MSYRPDETWHRLREWTSGSSKSERMSAQILYASGFKDIDPSHPLGGKDGGKDAVCLKDGERWIMACYFPRGQKPLKEIKDKFVGDLAGVSKNSAVGIAFVTNQELQLAERSELEAIAKASGGKLELLHLERCMSVLDQPDMAGIRAQFLDIDFNNEELKKAISAGFSQTDEAIKGYATGGDTYCYAMFYDFDINKKLARNFALIKKGSFPLYDIRLRLVDMDTGMEVVNWSWGEMSAPAEYKFLRWPLTDSIYYRLFFHARNGQWHQDLILKKSGKTQFWAAATRVSGFDGNPRFEYADNGFSAEFGTPEWRQ